jgi:hypothetical protein
MLAVLSSLRFDNTTLRLVESPDSFIVQELIDLDIVDAEPEFRTIFRKQNSSYGLEHCKLYMANYLLNNLKKESDLLYAV